MKFASQLFLCLISVVSSSAALAEQPTDPKAQLEMSAFICKQDQQAAVSAVALRDKGKTKEEMARLLPERGPNNNRMAQLMYEVLDDVYGYPEIRQFPYYVFRSEVCFREAQRKSIPVGFRLVAADVLACQSKYGDNEKNEIIDCIRDAIIKGSGTKP
ncbi:hypothetical protein [Pseudoduganella violaceinigra]|uniref:hypothetical protein n=1 Tax=Pseudoduganella violaceinigra TaxID=246602 RepID=UPI0012B5E06A|nr:hypothetical protein [Pseudoduganella violaceinigra]